METILKQIENWEIEDLLKLNEKIYFLIDGINRDFLFKKPLHKKIDKYSETLIEIPKIHNAVRLCNALCCADIQYWEDLQNITESELLIKHHFGKKIMELLKKFLKEQNEKNNTNFKFQDETEKTITINPSKHIYSFDK